MNYRAKLRSQAKKNPELAKVRTRCANMLSDYKKAHTPNEYGMYAIKFSDLCKKEFSVDAHLARESGCYYVVLRGITMKLRLDFHVTIHKETILDKISYSFDHRDHHMLIFEGLDRYNNNLDYLFEIIIPGPYFENNGIAVPVTYRMAVVLMSLLNTKPLNYCGLSDIEGPQVTAGANWREVLKGYKGETHEFGNYLMKILRDKPLLNGEDWASAKVNEYSMTETTIEVTMPIRDGLYLPLIDLPKLELHCTKRHGPIGTTLEVDNIYAEIDASQFLGGPVDDRLPVARETLEFDKWALRRKDYSYFTLSDNTLLGTRECDKIVALTDIALSKIQVLHSQMKFKYAPNEENY